MHKLLCPTCNHVIETDQEEFTYCPNCFKKVSIEQGERNLSIFVSRHLYLGKVELKQATEYKKAIEDYKKVLEVEPTNFEASEGVVFASLYSSTLREPHLKDANELLIQYKDTLRIQSMNFERSVEFIEKLNSDLVYYKDEVTKRLKGDEGFYEEDGLKLYKSIVNDLIAFKETIVDLYFSDRKFPSKSSLTKESLLLDIKNLKNELKTKYSVESNPLHKLNTSVDETYIRDDIFKDNRELYKKRNSAIRFIFYTLSLMIVGIILIFALPSKLLIGVPIASVGLIGFITSIIIGVIRKNKLNR